MDHNGVYTNNPFKVIPTFEQGGTDDGNGGKPMEALGMTEAEATTIKNNQQWWFVKERDKRLKLTDWISG